MRVVQLNTIVINHIINSRGVHLPRVFCIKTYSRIARDNESEALVKPPVIARTVQHGLSKVVQTAVVGLERVQQGNPIEWQHLQFFYFDILLICLYVDNVGHRQRFNR